jgi:hypothetical protein
VTEITIVVRVAEDDQNVGLPHKLQRDDDGGAEKCQECCVLRYSHFEFAISIPLK